MFPTMRWFKRFREGDFSLEDKPRSGRPLEVYRDEIEVLLEEELLIEGLVLLNQIVEPARVRALSMTQRGIFHGGATLLLPMMIVVKD